MESDVIIGALRSVTGKWAKQRKSEERDKSRAANRRQAMTRCSSYSLSDAAWHCMKDAYMKASAGGTLAVTARQIMYAARGPMQQATGRMLDDKYFTQRLLPDYMRANAKACAEWDVVFDARGHFVEPHTSRSIPLGTLDVRSYLAGGNGYGDDDDLVVDSGLYPTHGPDHRFGAVLFIEKEGFWPLFKQIKLAERFDLAIMSTKGMSVVASRALVDQVCGTAKIPLLILHDFDVAGFSIRGTIAESNHRYRYKHKIEVIDLGLRLGDVEALKLESESVAKRGSKQTLRRHGATPEEIDFLASGWRVELNAMTAGQLREWLEAKLVANGVRKVVPDSETLAEAYRRAVKLEHMRQRTEELEAEAQEFADATEVPADLTERVRQEIEADPTRSWDRALSSVAGEVA